MPELMRFGQVDKMAHTAESWSGYHYGFNNPLRFSDPDGNESTSFTYNDGYGTMDSRNSTGSVGFSGSYTNTSSTVGGDPPSWVQKLFDFFGFFKQPESQEEAQTYADRQGQLSGISKQWESAEEKIIDKTEYIPLVGSAAKLSKAMVDKDNTSVVTGSIMFALDATGGGGASKILTKIEQKSISSLKEQIAKHESKLAEYIKNPFNFDNKGFLQNAPNDAIRQRIIQSRINHLEQEIKVFQSNIQKILNGK